MEAIMNKSELQAALNSKIAFQDKTAAEVLQHFDEKFEKVPYKEGFLYICNHDREFLGREHIVFFAS